jgi:short-subunit dehydrogenase
MSDESGATRWAVVTGASSGIGAAFARALAARGLRVALVARRRERLEQLAGELGGGLALPLDLADRGGCAELEARLRAEAIEPDLLVNNAGSGDTGPFAEQAVERIVGMVELNARALVELTRRLLPGMLARRRGAIVNVVSTGAFQPVPFLNVYSATKSLVLSFSEGLATELEGSGVYVQALCPGLTDTEFFEAAQTGPRRWVNKLPRMTPEAVVAASLRGLDRRRLRVVPGFADLVNSKLVHLVPGRAVRALTGALYRER